MASQVDLVQVASKAFESANNYDEVRKDHSLESAKLFLAKLNNNEKSTVLELAAGTGKFTKVLLQAIDNDNIQLIASEPVESMGKVLKKNFPALEFICCRSEKIPLPDSSVQAVVATNALHYISNPESFTEIGRILVPGGITAFICNYVDIEAAPWAQSIFDLSKIYYQSVGVRFIFNERGFDGGWQEMLINTGVFGEIKEEFTTHSDSITEEDALKLFMSYGSFQYCSEEEKKDAKTKIEKILKDNYSGVGKIMRALPMKCFMYWAEKKNAT
ncbi:uncharacterized methyltransferase C25B8.09-like [Actinia tenebrosa]|uniref:Uncharacterized methyltransferase C25B8.09-like n=1 Tax=Actinia tenebrosa TaxID=6105 RepID=A0A6P8J3D6_ACTTE|nr:uncharacterized methyltransferase C25B8.09-like [Actinia tenebrosa]XP_031574119.1 uncharacterized methyltransferase C25B8.09-like [Actinia tenebrosa]